MDIVSAILFAHSQPVSTVQLLLQPSKLSVFPSSHSSVGVMKLSPQTGTQVEGDEGDPPVHEYPLMGPVQSGLQPTPSVVSPSSHASPCTFLLSPHIGTHVVSVIAVLLDHVQPGSIVHEFVQPSQFTVFPSSQDSVGVITLSPQTG